MKTPEPRYDRARKELSFPDNTARQRHSEGGRFYKYLLQALSVGSTGESMSYFLAQKLSQLKREGSTRVKK